MHANGTFFEMSTLHESRSALPLGSKEFGMKRRCGPNKALEKENLGPLGRSSAKKPKLSSKPVHPAISSLQELIDRENKIRDGAAKLLQASKSHKQSVEASRCLFVSNTKTLALMRELQQRQLRLEREGETENMCGSKELQPCKAKIAISEIRIPLEWKEFEHSKGKTDSHAQFGVFCLFKMGNQVMDTPALAEVDRNTMDISFRDTIIFSEEVSPDFTLEVEVYCSIPNEESSSHKPSTPLKMFKKLRSKDRVDESPAHGTFSAIPSSPYTTHHSTVTPSHRFALAGYAQFSLRDVSGSCRTYMLTRGTVGSSGTASTSGGEGPLLPLWGHICCKLMAQPTCATEPRVTGFINAQRMIGGLPDWVQLWCVLRQSHLRCWTYPEDVGRKLPAHCIELTESMVVENAPRLMMRRPNSLLLKDSSAETFLSFASREEREQWMIVIQQAILDLKVWKSFCSFIIPVPHSKFYTVSPSKETTPPDTSEGHYETQC